IRVRVARGPGDNPDPKATAIVEGVPGSASFDVFDATSAVTSREKWTVGLALFPRTNLVYHTLPQGQKPEAAKVRVIVQVSLCLKRQFVSAPAAQPGITMIELILPVMEVGAMAERVDDPEGLLLPR